MNLPESKTSHLPDRGQNPLRSDCRDNSYKTPLLATLHSSGGSGYNLGRFCRVLERNFVPKSSSKPVVIDISTGEPLSYYAPKKARFSLLRTVSKPRREATGMEFPCRVTFRLTVTHFDDVEDLASAEGMTALLHGPLHLVVRFLESRRVERSIPPLGSFT